MRRLIVLVFCVCLVLGVSDVGAHEQHAEDQEEQEDLRETWLAAALRSRTDRHLPWTRTEMELLVGSGRDLAADEVRNLYNCLLSNGPFLIAHFAGFTSDICEVAEQLVGYRARVKQYARSRGAWFTEQFLRLRDVVKYGGDLDFDAVYAKQWRRHRCHDANVDHVDENGDDFCTERAVCAAVLSSALRSNGGYNAALDPDNTQNGNKEPVKTDM
ncbi:MAG: hypothetical protein MHM6MM_003536 [Cercozoa sp. M6MM]